MSLAPPLVSRSARYRRVMESLMIRNEAGNLVPMRFSESQEIYWQYVAPLLDQHLPIRLICLKARQVYASTFFQALLFTHTMSRHGVHAMTIAHDLDTTHELLNMAKRFYEHIPLPKVTTPKMSELVFPSPLGASRYQVQSAKVTGKGRGGTRTCVHACLHGDSLVMTSDGYAIPIRQVVIGAMVYTHSGVCARVNGTKQTPAASVAGGGQLIEITPWLCSYAPIRLTPDHRVWTRRGWVEAAALRLTDELFIPVRPITGTMTELPLHSERITKRHGGRLRRSGSIPLNRETGFFFGYYLAEGSIKKQAAYRQIAASIDLSSHISEERYQKRAICAVEPWLSSWSMSDKRPAAQTLVSHLYGTSLAETVKTHFGERAGKHIPSWVFQAPKDFSLGLLEGYICGDGSKNSQFHQNYVSPLISITSVRLQPLLQLRYLLASLRIGWAGLAQKPHIVDRRGWKTQPAWVLQIAGLAAIRMRSELGWDLPDDTEATKRRRQRTQKYDLTSDGVWLRIRSLGRATTETVWDLSVDHPDHSFETIAGVVSNSELAYWPNPGIKTGVAQSVPDLPDTIWVEESTANGKRDIGQAFYEDWLAAVSGDSDLTPIFIPWFTMRKYRRAPGIPEAEWTDYERKVLHEVHGCNGEQIAWRRWRIKSKTQGSVEIFNQEFPSSPEVSFIASGSPAFSLDAIESQRKAVTAPTARAVIEDGKIADDPKGYIRIWKEPIPGRQYVIGADTAEGLGGDQMVRDDRDYAAAEILDMETLDQVASVHGRIQPWDFADILNVVGRWYNTALLCVEINNHGHSVQDRLIRELTYPNLHRWRGKPDRMKMTPTRVYGWETNSYSRPLMIDSGRRVINTGLITIHEDKLLQELADFSMMDNGRYEAEYGHDDRVLALLMALRSREENYHATRLPPTVSTESDDRLGIRIMEHRDFTTDGLRHVSKVLKDRARQAVKHWMEF